MVACEGLDRWQDPVQLGVGTNRRRTRASRFAADVQQVDSSVDHAARPRQNGFDIGQFAAVAEGVGRDVEDSDHMGT